MINGLGVLGWGVGGIEAEAAMLGQPVSMLIPEVVGFKFTGKLAEGATGTDLVLRVTQMLRERGVVGKFVEFYGPGLSTLPLASRATIANMSPEYGATMGFFPVDAETLRYLRFSGRDEELVELVEQYTKEQGLFRTDDTPDPVFSDTLELDLGAVEPAIAGPKRPQDRVPLTVARSEWRKSLLTLLGQGAELDQKRVSSWLAEGGNPDLPTENLTDPQPLGNLHDTASVTAGGRNVHHAAWLGRDRGDYQLHEHFEPRSHARGRATGEEGGRAGARDEAVGEDEPRAGLEGGDGLPRRRRADAVPRCPWLQPGGLRLHDLHRELRAGGGAHRRGHPPRRTWWPRPCSRATATSKDESTRKCVPTISLRRRWSWPTHWPARWISTSRRQPLGQSNDGKPVYLEGHLADAGRGRRGDPDVGQERDVPQAVQRSVQRRRNVVDASSADRGAVRLGPGFDVREEPAVLRWHAKAAGAATRYRERARARRARGFRDNGPHLARRATSAPTGRPGSTCESMEVPRSDFNSYGSRRGNHEVMVRGTFANIRLHNVLAPGTEGGVTRHLPDGEEMSIFEASELYQAEGVPLIILAGKEYGAGSSRDWAAKGVALLGVQAAIAESFERIHRSNLIGMGVLPLQYLPARHASVAGPDRPGDILDFGHRRRAIAAQAVDGYGNARRRHDVVVRRCVPHRHAC